MGRKSSSELVFNKFGNWIRQSCLNEADLRNFQISSISDFLVIL